MNLRFLKVKRTLPKRLLAAVLALAAIAGVVAGREKPSVEMAAAGAPPARAAQPVEPDIDLARLRRTAGSPPQTDPFAPRKPAAARSAAVKAAPRREAPPLPFTYVGRLEQNGVVEVYIMRGDELIAVNVGGKVGREYHVEAITDTVIRFTYLPLGTRQSLPLAEVQG